MGKILINHHQPRIYRAEGLVFKPGINQVDEDDLRRAGRNKLLRQRFANRVLTLADGSAFDFDGLPEAATEAAPAASVPTTEYALAALSATEAVSLVGQTVDRDLLKEWADMEAASEKPRKSVQSAIEKQLEAVTPKADGDKTEGQ